MAGRDEAGRERARRLVARGGLTRAEVARRCGVHPRTLGKWIAAGRWRIGPASSSAAAAPGAPRPRAVPAPSPSIAPDRWEAARRLFAGSRAGAADIAVVLGLPPTGAEAALAAHGLLPRQGARAGEAAGDPAGLDGPTLRRRLRRHVARQIAVLDAQLAEDAASSPRAPDSARMLRDAAGLKRVIDALDLEDGAGAGKGGEECGGEGGGDPDFRTGTAIGLLREAIARRYEAFEGGGPAEGLPGEPA